MRVTLNLASKPYVELRPLYQRLRVMIGGLALLALLFWYIGRTEYSRAQAVQAQVDAIQNSIDRVKREQLQHEAEMKQPKNAAVLNQAQFLNQLFLRKAFSWTAVMIDLEHVLPAGVQVLNIDPAVAKDGHVSVRLRVLGPHDRAVDLVRNLEKSKRFLSPKLTAEQIDTSSTATNASFQPNAVSSRSDFDIIADYNPLPVKVEAKSEDAGDRTTKAEKKAEKRAEKERSAEPAVPLHPVTPKSAKPASSTTTPAGGNR